MLKKIQFWFFHLAICNSNIGSCRQRKEEGGQNMALQDQEQAAFQTRCHFNNCFFSTMCFAPNRSLLAHFYFLLNWEGPSFLLHTLAKPAGKGKRWRWLVTRIYDIQLWACCCCLKMDYMLWRRNDYAVNALHAAFWESMKITRAAAGS